MSAEPSLSPERAHLITQNDCWSVLFYKLCVDRYRKDRGGFTPSNFHRKKLTMRKGSQRRGDRNQDRRGSDSGCGRAVGGPSLCLRHMLKASSAPIDPRSRLCVHEQVRCECLPVCLASHVGPKDANSLGTASGRAEELQSPCPAPPIPSESPRDAKGLVLRQEDHRPADPLSLAPQLLPEHRAIPGTKQVLSKLVVWGNGGASLVALMVESLL